MGSQAEISWATVVAGRGAAYPEARGAARLRSVAEAQGVAREQKGAVDANGTLVTTGLTTGTDATVAPPGAQRTERPKDRQAKRGRGSGTGRTVEIAGVGELPLDLPDKILFEVLNRVPITELRC
jgi:hypothetical protein